MFTKNVVQLLHETLEKAILLGASDIHFEPHGKALQIRYRVDGILNDDLQIPKSLQNSLVSRIKVLVNLDIAEQRLPQDGRIHQNINNKKIDLRISTLPTLQGEKVVMRILHRDSALISLEGLGMEKENLEVFHSLFKKKHGLILVTGPTGSGKTTTLYAALQKLNSRAVNIITIEDPIEYQLAGINQIQAKPKIGLTFAKGLRHILRQDPDVIMIGEIRDTETAKIAIQSALTGHLVLSTLHTNDAPSAVNRLVDMGVEKYLVEAATIGIIAQRLVRKITPNGYKGRTGIYEIMRGTTPQKDMHTLLQDGIIKIKKGITTEEELQRVISL